MYRPICLALFLVIAVHLQAQNVIPCLPCEELKAQHHLPDLTIQSAEITEENGTSFCRVLGTIGTEINFELLLPDQWNARYVMGGGGGFVGTIQNSARGTANEGYATSGTDTGHKGRGAGWALNSVERRVNFGHLAVHRTAEVSKSLIYRYYCQNPEYNYFMGCSRGGGQALIEAQRYPNDFDGIVSAAPIIDWLATGLEFIQNIKALYPDPSQLNEPMITAHHLQILQDEVLRQCDALDGVKDNILNDPRMCAFDYSALPQCESAAGDSSCFTQEQLEVVKTIYQGAENAGMSYPGFPFGGEASPGGFGPWIVGPGSDPYPSAQFYFGVEMFKYIVYQDEDWNYIEDDLDNIAQDGRDAAEYLNATSTDYSEFNDNGGKLILYHGWNDPALSALTAINHYQRVEQENENTSTFYRLFLLPGMLHCGGGPGPDQAEWLTHIRNWVEEGEAPERIIVSKRNKDGEAIMSRPVFPYPAVAEYKGGDANVESNFVRKDR